MQLTARVVTLGVAMLLTAATSSSAYADELVLRGNYWRDRNTRILQPEVDVTKEARTGTIVGAHYLLDTITSASVAAGAVRDEPFTELRHEVGLRLGQRVGPVTLTGSYSYSSESDYWAHYARLGAVAELFGKNTTISTAITYNHDKVAQRQGATVYLELGKLDAVGWTIGISQVMSKSLLMSASYEILVNGFGKSTNGFQSNAYRPANVGGSPLREQTPFQRIRQAVSASGNWTIPVNNALVPWIAFRLSMRLYFDDWGIFGATPELRTFLPIGPVEFRFTGRYHNQTEASFFRTELGVPFYTQGVGCPTCTKDSVKNGAYFTADPKLSKFDTVFLEARVLVRMTFLRRLPRLPMGKLLSESFFEISYGKYISSNLQRTTFGDAHVAGLTFTFPL